MTILRLIPDHFTFIHIDNGISLRDTIGDMFCNMVQDRLVSKYPVFCDFLSDVQDGCFDVGISVDFTFDDDISIDVRSHFKNWYAVAYNPEGGV